MGRPKLEPEKKRKYQRIAVYKETYLHAKVESIKEKKTLSEWINEKLIK